MGGLPSHSDVHGINELLRELRDDGNTVLVVEHDPDVIEIADHIVDIGPEAGENGGVIVYEGDIDGLYEADTPTGRHMSHRMPIKSTFRQPTGQLTMSNAFLDIVERNRVSGGSAEGNYTIHRLQEDPEVVQEALTDTF